MKEQISSWGRQAWAFWNQFWFDYSNPMALAFMRLLLSSVLLYLYIIRQAKNMIQFTDAGLVPRAMALKMMPEFYQPPFAWFFWPDSMAVMIHGIFLILVVLVFLGVRTRWFAPLAWVIQIGFIQRNYAILFGADVIACLFLFYLGFTRCDEVWSLRAWWRNRKDRPGGAVAIVQEGLSSKSDMVSSAFTRLLQIQVSIIYAYTGFEKLKGSSWWDGTALWTVLGNQQMVVYDLSFLRNFPLLIAVMTFATIVMEIYWPAAMFHPKSRRLWLMIGVSFHVGIGILMGLWPFSLVMMSTYLLFIPPQTLAEWWTRIQGRWIVSA